MVGIAVKMPPEDAFTSMRADAFRTALTMEQSLKFLIALVLILLAPPALAQIRPPGHSGHEWPILPTPNPEGPNVPCYGCEGNPPLFDAPSSGLWQNPSEPGTGFTFTVQGSSLSGLYHGYDEQGHALWHPFAGQLERPKDEPRLLRLTAILEGTNKTITLEFDQRNHGSFSLAGDQKTHIVPVVEGIDATRHFPEYADYYFPDLNGVWIIVMEKPIISGVGEAISYIGGLLESETTPWQGATMWEYHPIDAFGTGDFYCANVHDHQSYDHVDCRYSDISPFGGNPDRFLFPMPYANFGANRITSANPETGIRMRAFRSRFD